MMTEIGYLTLDENWRSHNLQFHLDQIHQCQSKSKMTPNGFEFYENPVECLHARSMQKKANLKYCQLRILGPVTKIGNKFFTTELELVKEIIIDDFLALCTGQVKLSHDNGLPAVECEYKKGVLHGIHAEWFPDGKMKFKAEYDNGKRHGSYTKWYPSGQKKLEDHYQNGLQHGMDREWYPSGQIKIEAYSENNILVGVPINWSEDGVRKHD